MSGPFHIDELVGADESPAPADDAATLATARAIEAAVSTEPARLDPDREFTDRVMAAIAAVPAPRRRGIGSGSLLLAAAIALGSLGGLAVAGGLGLLDGPATPSPEIAVSPSPSASASASPSPSPSPSPEASASPDASGTPRAIVTPRATPTGGAGTPEPTDTAEPTGTDDRGSDERHGYRIRRCAGGRIERWIQPGDAAALGGAPDGESHRDPRDPGTERAVSTPRPQ